MRTIYGTKVLTEEDLFDTYCRPRNIMEFIKMNIEQTLSELNEARYDFRHKAEFQSNEFKLSFIPIDVIEQYVIFKTVERSMGMAEEYMVSINGIDRVNLIAKSAKERISECIDCYADSMSDILKTICMVFVYDIKTDAVKDICVAIPKKIIDKINAPMEYTCNLCGKIDKSDVLPDNTMYTVIDNKVVYYCKHCSHCIEHHTVHVGEEFFHEFQ